MIARAAACALGLLFAALVVPSIVVHLGTTEFPVWLDVGPGSRTVAFAIALSLLTALLFGVVPALRASSVSPGEALKAGGTQHSGRIGSAGCWPPKVGFSVAVLFLSGLLLLSFRKLISVDLGFAPDNVVLFDLAPRNPESHRPDSGAELLAHLRHLPAVQKREFVATAAHGWRHGLDHDPHHPPARPRLPARRNRIEVPCGDCEPSLRRRVLTRAKPHRPNLYFYKTGNEPEPDPVPQQIVGVVANARCNNLREPEGQPSTRRSPMRPPPRSTSEPPPGPLRWSLGCARKSKQPAPIPGSFEVRGDPVHFGSYKPIASAKCG